jgi:hypothetical protein
MMLMIQKHRLLSRCEQKGFPLLQRGIEGDFEICETCPVTLEISLGPSLTERGIIFRKKTNHTFTRIWFRIGNS